MCLIVDANVATQVLSHTPSSVFAPVHKALMGSKACIVYGGKLVEEYHRCGVTKFLKLLDQRGAARVVNSGDVDQDIMRLKISKQVKSNDLPILAIARISNVRLLCSHDKKLHSDFTNPQILSPPGNVYQNASHKRLIAKHCKPRQAS